MKIYRLADLGLVRVQADIYEQDLVYLKLGLEATVTLRPPAEPGWVCDLESHPNVEDKRMWMRMELKI